MDEKPIECPLCRTGKYPHFSYSGSGACDHCGAVWTYDEGDTLTEDSLRRLWQKVPRWIAVSERLPPEGQEVLAWNNGGQCEKPWQGCVLCEHKNGEWREFQERDLYPGVTHWMPLPEPPA